MDISALIKIITNSAYNYPSGTFSSKEKIYTCINPYSYHILRSNLDIYKQLDGIFIDGITMCWWLGLLWNLKIPRLSFDMSGMAYDLFSRLNESNNHESIYFIGAKQEEIEKSIKQFKYYYPNMNIVGFRNGYFSDDDDRQNSINDIISLYPTFVIVGLGSPLQEKFAIDLKTSGYNGIILTCGGFLHQSTNSINYYPKWVNKYNLRAFYRLFHEKGLWKRLYNVLIEFPILFIWDSIFTKYQYR